MRVQFKQIYSMQWTRLSPHAETLEWKYGKINIVDRQPLINQQANSFLITTDPFSFSQTSTHKQPIAYIHSSQSNKTLQKTEQILNRLYQKRANRYSKVYIKGGGMLLDLAGFASSIYMRGIKDIVYIPTTLLAMVDATVGGKTGVNFKGAKNIIGSILGNSFKSQTIIYIPYLYTLQRRELLNGMAEVIKMAATYDKELFQWLQSDQVGLQQLFSQGQEATYMLKKIVKRSLQIKIKVVQNDINERNERKWLNFGHTFGHGIQLSTGNYHKHGQCVSIGMVKACQIAFQKGIIKNPHLVDRLKKVLKKFELPTQIPSHLNKQQIVQLMLRDKKNLNIQQNQKQIEFVMIEQLGKRVMSGTTKVKYQQIIDFISQSVNIKYPTSKQINQRINSEFDFPGSKSLSLRMLFIGCVRYLIDKSRTKITNFLQSEDTNCMIISLKAMGFQFQANQRQKWIKILGRNESVKIGKLYVGNSGITTRFILPFCCLVEGSWQIQCVQRMTERPNQTIINICKQIFSDGISFEFLKKDQAFPLKITSKDNINSAKQIISKKTSQQDSCYRITVPSKQSSQFLSALMINLFLISSSDQNLKIELKSMKDAKGTLVSQSYIKMTIQCLKQFNFKIEQFESQDYYTFTIVTSKKNQNEESFNSSFQEKEVQTDLSTLSYPFTLAYMLQIQPPKLPEKSMQGDKQFYQYLTHLNSICIRATPQSTQNHVIYDFNNCTDTFMTMSVFLARRVQGVQNLKVSITNISNQRVKESNRIFMTLKNLRKIGIKIQQYDDKIVVHQGFDYQFVKAQKRIVFQTANDHRLAMSMGILSVYLSKMLPETQFIIDNRKCVEKTFPQFWDYLTRLGCQLKGYQIQKQFKYQTQDRSLIFKRLKKETYQPIFLIGNRGCGKSFLGMNVAKMTNRVFIDLDEEITKEIKQSSLNHLVHIKDYVDKYGWGDFRQLQSRILQKFVNMNFNRQCIIATGGGIIDRLGNRQTLKRQRKTFYIERRFDNLVIEHNENRPKLDNFAMISKTRQFHYEDVANFIVNIPKNECGSRQALYLQSMISKAMGQARKLKQGYILCLNQIPCQKNQYYHDIFQKDTSVYEELSALQIRVDEIIEGTDRSNLFSFRQNLANFVLQGSSSKLASLPYILTLRTLAQYGRFNQANRYFQVLNLLRKIPCDFLDHQIKYFNNPQHKSGDFPFDLNKIIWSYHGSQELEIKKLIQVRKGIKKLCTTEYQLFNSMKHQMDICVNLNDRMSRFGNKYQMVVPRPIKTELNKTGIFGLNQMRTINLILKGIK